MSGTATAKQDPEVTKEQASIQITYIGGGSRSWAQALMSDLALCSQLTGELVLYDIDEEAAAFNVGVADKIFKHKDAVTSFATRSETNLDQALKGADIVVMSIEPGPTEARYGDLVVPERYGIHQTVGDTSGPGGTLRALRCLPHYINFAQAIERNCPKAWVINYTNPMTMCTAALYAAFPKIKAFGCCHEVFGTQSRLAGLVKEYFNVERPHRSEIKLDITGVNHFTWATKASWNGHDLFPVIKRHIEQSGFFDDQTAQVQKRIAEESYFGSSGRIAYDFFRQFGVLGAAGDRHLVEFVPWYLGSREDIHYMDVPETPYEWRLKARDEKKTKGGDIASNKALQSSGEEGVVQILALLGLADLDTNVNVPNQGQINWLPDGAVVESYAQFRRDSLTPL